MSGSEANRATTLLPEGYRAAGVLLHVTSLPSDYGIGDLGPDAYQWVDRLAAAGQQWWQILPLGPTGQGNSPYDPLSTFAGNLMLISPRRMFEDGLLTATEIAPVPLSPERVEFDAVRQLKSTLVEIAWQRFSSGQVPDLQADFDRFRTEHAHWLDDFALFMAIKARLGGAYFYEWPQPYARREEETLRQVAQESAERIEFSKFVQFVFFRQWQQLRTYAHQRGVRLMGDLPFFVAHDSAEVWANPDLFLLDERRHPSVVAGVPPDYFSATGQRWGNPIYDWERMRTRGYRWWMRRLGALLHQVDGVRLDHFRAFSAAWHIPASAPTAVAGQWVDGPGEDFFEVAQRELGGLPFIAEDLGLITDDVRQLRDAFALPGMSVLQFAFDGDPDNLFLPHQHHVNSVAFTGTHDNNTTRGWFTSLVDESRRWVEKFFGRQINETTIAPKMLETVWESRAALAIAPLQDVLNLGGEARMNVPGQASGNWGWRVRRDQWTDAHFDALGELTAQTERSHHGV